MPNGSPLVLLPLFTPRVTGRSNDNPNNGSESQVDVTLHPIYQLHRGICNHQLSASNHPTNCPHRFFKRNHASHFSVWNLPSGIIFMLHCDRIRNEKRKHERTAFSCKGILRSDRHLSSLPLTNGMTQGPQRLCSSDQWGLRDLLPHFVLDSLP